MRCFIPASLQVYKYSTIEPSAGKMFATKQKMIILQFKSVILQIL